MLITFEGIDGCGKSTQARLLADHLRTRGHDPLVVREPGGEEVAEKIRDLLLSEEQEIAPMAEMLLFSAARAQLVARRIRPALGDGRIVICDRFYDSTTASQALAQDIVPTEWAEALHERTAGGLSPDLTLLIRVPVEEVQRRSEATDRMEKKEEAFWRAVSDGYETVADRHGDRVVKIDGSGSISDVQERVQSTVHLALMDGSASDDAPD